MQTQSIKLINLKVGRCYYYRCGGISPPVKKSKTLDRIYKYKCGNLTYDCHGFRFKDILDDFDLVKLVRKTSKKIDFHEKYPYYKLANVFDVINKNKKEKKNG